MSDMKFWDWFSQNSEEISRSYSDDKLIANIDEKVLLAWPDLAWELGPELSGGLYFALSPNLNRDLMDKARHAIHGAPEIPGWRFYATRQLKSWNGQFEIITSRGLININAFNWQYTLLRYPDGECEILFFGTESDILTENERWQAAAIVAESLLGEACILEKGLSFALNSYADIQFSENRKSVLDLPKAIGITAPVY